MFIARIWHLGHREREKERERKNFTWDLLGGNVENYFSSRKEKRSLSILVEQDHKWLELSYPLQFQVIDKIFSHSLSWTKLNSLVMSLSRELRTNTARNSARSPRNPASIRNRNFRESARDSCECQYRVSWTREVLRSSLGASPGAPVLKWNTVRRSPARVIEKYAPAAAILGIWIICASCNYRKCSGEVHPPWRRKT